MNRKYYAELGRDLKQTAEANRAKFLSRMDELESREAQNAGIRVFVIGVALVIIVALIEAYVL